MMAGVMDQDVKMVITSLENIRRQPGLSNFNAPFVGERFVMDICKVRRQLGYTPTPLESWLKLTVRWFLSEYHGPDSPHYDNRGNEVAAARRLLKA
jgi:nucleoside-diphosphate-sugar epimerase